MTVKDLKQKISIKHFMVGYLSFFLLLSSFYLESLERLWRGIILVVLYSLFDFIWTRVKDKVWYLPISSWISGLILALVVAPALSWPLLVLLPFLAAVSKYLLKFGRTRYIFNPAAFVLGAAAIFAPVVSWWGVRGLGEDAVFNRSFYGNFYPLAAKPLSCGHFIFRVIRVFSRTAVLGKRRAFRASF